MNFPEKKDENMKKIHENHDHFQRKVPTGSAFRIGNQAVSSFMELMTRDVDDDDRDSNNRKKLRIK